MSATVFRPGENKAEAGTGQSPFQDSFSEVKISKITLGDCVQLNWPVRRH